MNEETIESLPTASGSPCHEVLTEQQQQSKPLERLTNERQLREELEDEVRHVYAKLRLQDRGNKLGAGPFAPLFRGLLPRSKTSQADEYNSATSDISKHLAEQRHQLALDRKNVQIENLTIDRRRLQEQWRSSLSRTETLAAELRTLQETLTQAQWGVVQYHNKCDKQRRQLGDVQIANANLKRENARLRDDVKRLRRRAREAQEALMAPTEEIKRSCIDRCEADLNSCKTESSGSESRTLCNQDEETTLVRPLNLNDDKSQSREATRHCLSRHAVSLSNLNSPRSDAQSINVSGTSENETGCDDTHHVGHASMSSLLTDQGEDIFRVPAE